MPFIYVGSLTDNDEMLCVYKTQLPTYVTLKNYAYIFVGWESWLPITGITKTLSPKLFLNLATT